MIYSTRYFQIKMPGYQRNTPPPVVGEASAEDTGRPGLDEISGLPQQRLDNLK